MEFMPLTKKQLTAPLVPAREREERSVPRLLDMELSLSLLTQQPVSIVQPELPGTARNARQVVDQATPGELEVVLGAQAEGQTPEQAAERLVSYQQKRDEWIGVGDNLYLEQAITLGDPTVDANITRIATNLQIGQEVLEAAMETAEPGILGKIGAFIDREILRATVIGGFEQVTNRNERKGAELMAAAASLPPNEFKTFMEAYADELRGEGFFLPDNYLAYQQGIYELQTAGSDPNELINRAFGVLDVAGLATVALKVPSAVASTGKLLKSTSTLSRVGSLKGPEAASEAAETLLRANADAPIPEVVKDTTASALVPRPTGPVRPHMGRSARIAEDNKIIRGLRELNEKNFLGRDATQGSAVQAATARITNIMRTATNNPIVDIGRPTVRMDATGGSIFEATLGTVKTGSPFKTSGAAEKAAQRLRDEFPTTRVDQVDPSDATKGYYVKVEERLDLGAEAQELSMQSALNPVQRLFRYTVSKAAIEDRNLNNLATLAEGGVTSIGRLIKPEVKKLDRLPAASKDTLSDIFTELRDGSDSFLRDNYTPEEFAAKWKQRTGKMPTPQDYEGFQALRDINDASWMMRTHERLQKYVRSGYYALSDNAGEKLAGKAVENAPKTDLARNLTSGKAIRIGDLSPRTKVWKLDRRLDDGTEYVVQPAKVGILSPEDVLGYNAGGRRINPNANYFVTAGRDKPRAFLAAFSEKQARDAVDSIRKVQAQMADDISDTRKLDEIVAANNDWNPEIQTFRQLEEFASQKGFKLTEDIEFKTRDGEIRTGEVADEFSTSWGEYVTFGMKRQDDLLTEYGGKEAMQMNPVVAMFQDFSTTANHYAHNVITQEGIEGWLKAARRKGSGWDVPPHQDPRKAFMGARMVESGNAAATELQTQANILKSRMNVKGEYQRMFENWGQSVREFTFDKTGFKAPDGVADAVQNKLLGLGFQSAFGFLNPAQLVVQGYHGLVIAGMAPKHGVRGLMMMPAVRVALMSDDIAVEGVVIQRLAKTMGMKPEDAKELIEYIQTSARNDIDASAVENGTNISFGLTSYKGDSIVPNVARDAKRVASKTVSNALDVSTLFFKEGDRVARITGINTAFLEFKAANPGVSAFSEYGRKWITQREQALTLHMTNANRATIQEGIGKLPTQWFSHSLRVWENAITGRNLTSGERARMLAMYMPMFGMTGMGFGSAAMYVSEKLGAEEGGTRATLIKYGLIDAFLKEIGDIDIALGSRMAPITFFQDMYKNMEGDKSVFEMALGPSGDIASGFVEQTVRAIGDALSGNSVAMTNDVVRIMRQFSGVDNVYKAFGIMQNGMYRSRSGIRLPFELDTSDAIWQLLGFTPAEVGEWYQLKEFQYNRSQSVRDFQNMMQTDWEQALEMLDSGNRDRGLALLREIGVRINLSGLSEYDKMLVRRGLEESRNRDIVNIIMDEFRRENDYMARTLEDTFQIRRQD